MQSIVLINFSPDYLFVIHRSAIEFILNVEATSLTIDPMEFKQKLAAAEVVISGGENGAEKS
jgi:hypothetical protein